MKVFAIDEPTFKTEPLFVLGCSHAELRRYLKRHFRVSIDPQPDGLLGTVLTLNGPPWRVVWLARATAWPELLHEVFHLVTRICQDRGVPIVAHHPDGTNGDETAAYLFEYFVRELQRRRVRG